MRMSGIKTCRDLKRDTHCFLNLELTLLIDISLKRDTVHELHDDIVHTLFFTDIINAHDVRMGDRSYRLCLLTELRYKFGILTVLGLKNLQCHKSIKSVILRTIDVGHTSGSDLLKDLITISDHTSNVDDHNKTSCFLSLSKS